MKDLHTFWFEKIELTLPYYERQIKRWFFRNSPEFDLECAEYLNLQTYDPLLQILIYDQLPRNVFRGSAKAYACDQLAQKLAISFIETDYEKALTLPERIFLYMPMEYAEKRELQNISVKKFQELHDLAPVEIKPWTKLGVMKALDHRQTILTYGHFSQRSRSDEAISQDDVK